MDSKKEDDEVKKIYLYRIIEKIRGQESLIVLGNWNETICETKKKVELLINIGFEARTREYRCVEFCYRHRLIIINLYFQHCLRRYTWKAPGYRRREQIEYILVKKIFRN